ncbi:MAG TPA: type II toxin-antitoxin system HicA family toxin [Chloroflexota bacterium]|nr:type II toxin-antitoxin system HicA family toxin [Chloroflexota bacterium]
MSGRLPRIRARELLRALHQDGWFEHHRSGAHVLLRHPSKPGRVTVSIHSGTIIKLKTLASILDQAGLDADRLRDLL